MPIGQSADPCSPTCSGKVKVLPGTVNRCTLAHKAREGALSSITCTVMGDTVTLRFPDSSQADVPRDVVNRSRVLQDSICATKSDGEFLVGASPVHVERWLECVHSITAGDAGDVGQLLRAFDCKALAEFLEVRGACTFHSSCSYGIVMLLAVD